MDVKLPSKEVLGQLKDLASLAQKFILMVGVWILFCYCMSEQIMPDGLSFGDAIVLVMIALGFGVVMLIGGAYGALAALAPVKLMLLLANCRKREGGPLLVTFWRGHGMTLMSLFMMLILGLLLMGGYTKTTDDFKLTRTVASFVSIGFLLLCAFAVKREGGRPRKRSVNLALGMVAVAAPVLMIHPAVMNITMSELGIRSSPGSLIVINAENYPKIEEIVAQSGLHIHFCRMPESGNWVTTNALVVWQGVGTMSFVHFVDQGSAEKYISMSLPKASLHVIRPWNWGFSCDKVTSKRNVP